MRTAGATPPASSITVERGTHGHVARFGLGLLRPQLVSSTADGCRVGLLATTALLLGGDVVELEVRLGPGARLDLFDVAGTVAHHGRGTPSGWHVLVELAPRARLTYRGQPFVVSDGADVTRSLDLRMAADASAVLRDTVVLGRAGQVGGRLRSRTRVEVDGRLVLLEDQQLDPVDRRRPGLLGDHRVLDTRTALGCDTAGTTDLPRYALVDGAGSVTRWLGHDLSRSPLERVPPSTGVPGAR